MQVRAYRKLRDSGNLVQLKASIVRNGFIPVERIVVHQYAAQSGKFIVIEGNRRLAALRWIGEDDAAGVNIPENVKDTLKAVPVVVVEGEGGLEHKALMGVRHVSGINQWGGYQRAKLVVELRDVFNLDSTEVAERLALSVQEVNRRYRAFRALQQMRDDEEFGAYAEPQMYPLFHLGLTQGWVSPRDKIPLDKLKEAWVPLALVGLSRRLEVEAARDNNRQGCPECGAQMKPRNWYLKDWYYGALKACCFCKGSADEPHRRVAMGLLAGSQWQRLDRVVNSRTGQETRLPKRKRVTQYERDHGFVWCDLTSGRDDGCGGICTPEGKYRYHKASDFQVFRCLNRNCKQFYDRRLYCRVGKCFEAGSIPSAGRQSTIAEEARCFYCKGNHSLHSRGTRNAPTNCIQLYCKACGKISYFDQILRKGLPGRRPGGNFPVDPYRPTCKKCRKRKQRVHSCRFTKARLEKRPSLVPIPIRLRFERWPWLRQMFRGARAKGVVLFKYPCPHREIYKAADGGEVWRRKAGQELPRGRSFKYSLAHREGRPIIPIN